uniref:acyl carrier protein phosphodiesterase n=1 Tax=Flavobacterium sp. TaxID=239 RepID=UPI00404B7089
MNFLAHLYLSGDDDFIKIGNFMADGIRGKEYLNYPEQVQKGILLHRAIDTYTDNHAIFRQGKHRLHEKYHHYSGVLMDMYYDHFLAKNWLNYHHLPLENYADSFYELLKSNENMLSPRTLKMLPPMSKYNWLVQYASLDGLKNILTQMDFRTKNQSGIQTGIHELLNHYDAYQNEFALFFEEMQLHCENWLIENA